jgi:hypothetical protein
MLVGIIIILGIQLPGAQQGRMGLALFEFRTPSDLNIYIVL